jgi:small subunit ribosomal protein S25e|tara:strand:+ start:52 stop:363 length:312 start_codon:yes stop_codon:yes gene_type:complete
MGGSKNKSPAQKEKAQHQKDTEQKKGKKSKSEDSKTEIFVLIDESRALKYIKSAKGITAHDLARNTSVKISTANSFLQKSLENGIVKRIGGFSGHHVYQAVSE